MSNHLAAKFKATLPDALASLVVVLVAVPLCIGIAVACNVPPERGLITGVVGGLLVGIFSGSPLLVSGPAASLIVPVFDLVEARGLAALAPVVMLAGLWQIIAGRLRLGQWFRAVAPAVIHGMLLGIGVLIVSSQLHVAIDSDPQKSFIDNVSAFPGVILDRILAGDMNALAPVIVGAGTLIVLVGWNRFRPRFLNLIPGHLISVVSLTAAVALFELPVRFLDISPQFFSGLDPVDPGLVSMLADPSIIGVSLMFAFVASAATLLTAVAIDQRQSEVRTDYNRELMAQGIGNMTTGALGGLPMTGVIVRSSVNVDAGAKTRLSTILHGIWILAFVAVAPELLALIPRACLGAILVYVGVKLFNVEVLRMLYQRGRAELAICVITISGIVFVELFAGILMGLAAALAKLVYTFSHVDLRLSETPDGDCQLELSGSATFLRLPAIAETLDQVPADKPLHLRIGRLDHIDHACLELLSNWDQRRKAQGQQPMVVDWGKLSRRYHRTFRGSSHATGSRESSGAVVSLMLKEWQRIYAPMEQPENAPLPRDWLAVVRCQLDVDGDTLESVCQIAAEALQSEAGLPAPTIAAALLERGDAGGFSIGDGVAIPHASIPGLDRPLLTLITTRAPIQIAGEPVDTFFVLLTPVDEPRRHLLALAHIARLCHDPKTLEALRATSDEEEVRRILTRAETLAGEPAPAASRNVLAVIDFDDDEPAAHGVELLNEGLVPPLLLTVRDGPAFHLFCAAVQLPPSRRMVIVPVQERDTGVLTGLIAELENHWGTGTHIGLTWLRVGDPTDLAPHGDRAQRTAS